VDVLVTSDESAPNMQWYPAKRTTDTTADISPIQPKHSHVIMVRAIDNKDDTNQSKTIQINHRA